MKPEILHEYPPNYDEIVKAFPQCRRSGIIFAYHPNIYVPDGFELSNPLKVHEAVHCIRQERIGVEKWWQLYIDDEKFRYHEELLAHRAEYRAMVKENGNNRKIRRTALKVVAQRLSSPLYGKPASWKEAAKEIKDGLEWSEI